MIPQSARLGELPEYWQHQIRKLRQDNAKLRRERNEAREAMTALALRVAK